MTTENGADLDVSVSAELTETGIKASAKSRLVSAFDRLGGNLVDWLGSPFDGWNERRKARIAGEKALIEAVARYGVERIGNDNEFANRLISAQFGKLAREQINKDAVLGVALDELTAGEKVTSFADGPDTLADEFLDRFDSYASHASTEALRERWGRVLAAEVRKPGTFSNKVLRVIDELEGSTALLFEKLCEQRLADTLPKCLVGELPFADQAKLTTAGLIVEPGLGQSRTYQEVKTSEGVPFWLLALDQHAVAFPRNAAVPKLDISETMAVVSMDNIPGVPVYVLTDVALAISSILPDNSLDATKAYMELLRITLPNTEISRYSREGEVFKLSEKISPLSETEPHGENP